MTVKELFGLHFSFINKLFEKEEKAKGIEHLKAISKLLSEVKVFSLFSGLGGAELAVQQLFQAVVRKCKEEGIEAPSPPENLLSCDFDSACQKVLSQHDCPSRYIVDDMMRFLSPRCSLAFFNLNLV